MRAASCARSHAARRFAFPLHSSNDSFRFQSPLLAIEHLQTAEGLWDRWVQESDTSIDGYPSEVQVMTFMCKMSRTRQRMCLAQRGKRRTGGQRSVIKNYVSEMANNLWDTKYPAFAELETREQKEYWSKIFKAYGSMYASASAVAETEEDEERAEQLITQTEAVYKRKHCYRTEMFQLQDACIAEKDNVNEALIMHAALARVGMSACSPRRATMGRVCAGKRRTRCAFETWCTRCGSLC